MDHTEFRIKYVTLRETSRLMHEKGLDEQAESLLIAATKLREQYEAEAYTDYTMRQGEKGIPN
jgi:hypothetical protein